MVIGIPLIFCRDVVSKGCVLDKHHQDNFDKHTSYITLAPLQRVHGGLCGPLSSPSFFGGIYFLNLIDDFCICTWVYFLKLKSYFFDIFLAYKAFV